MLSGATPYPFTQIALSYTLTYLIGISVKIIKGDKTSVLPRPTCYAFAAGLVFAQALTMYGFKHISFFMGNMIKSSKTVSAIGVAFLMRDWKYINSLKWNTWIAVALITYGIISFNVLGDSKKTSEKGTSLSGFAAIFLALFIDSYVINKQRALIEQLKPTSLDLMVSFAQSSMILSILCAVLYDNEISKAYSNWSVNYESFLYVLIVSICGAIGQLFIFGTLNTFGPIKLTMITGSRKIVTIVLSIIIFAHPMNLWQVSSVILIIVSLFIEFSDSLKKKH